MSRADRYVVLGLAPVRSAWFRSVARWSNEAAIPVEFVKCISAAEVESRLDEERAYSALLVDELAPGLDRDLIDSARTRGCAAIIVSSGLVDREWRSLGASAVLQDRFDGPELVTTLRHSANPVGRPLRSPPDPEAHARTQVVSANTIVVAGGGGTGTSTVAMAIAQGMATEAQYRRLVLVDMALRADQALLHDVGDVVPALSELVDAHRLGVPDDDEIASMIHSVPDRGYHLVLGLRQHRDWLTISGRALDAAWTSLENLYTTIVVDTDDDFDGSAVTGAADLEDRNRLARTAARRARVVVAVGDPTTWGVRRLVHTILALRELGVAPGRILPCVNRGPRQPRARAEITQTVAALIGAGNDESPTVASPVFIPDRRSLDEVFRDGAVLPNSIVAPISTVVGAFLGRVPVPPAALSTTPLAVAPGSVGLWTDDA